MSETNSKFDPFDPTGMFKDLRDNSVDAWAKMMVKLVHTDAYAESTAKMLDAWLASSGPFRKAVDSSMSQALAGMNMPSLDDVTRLAERMTNIEIRLDDLDAKLDTILSRVSQDRQGS
ncbi:MAG: hypothetical protein AAGB00_01135 [Planctomycetota bacterium]